MTSTNNLNRFFITVYETWSIDKHQKFRNKRFPCELPTDSFVIKHIM